MTVTKLPLLFVLTFLLLVENGHAQSFPSPSGRVNDFAQVIAPAIQERLNALLAQVEAKTGAEIAVVTLQTIAPLDVEQYANELFTRWGIGKRKKDNGVLILLAITERKVRIEVGYGIEPILPDGRAGAIIREVIMPHFRRGQLGEGLYAGALEVGRVIANAEGVTLTAEGSRRNRPSSQRIPTELLLFFALPAAFFVLSSLANLRRPLRGGPGRHGFWVGGFPFGSYGGGGFGGSFGGFGGFGGGSSGGGGASGSW